MSASGKLVAEILSGDSKPDQTRGNYPGIGSVGCCGLSVKKKARPAFKGYHGFPFSLCVSVNEEVVHGFPSGRQIGGRRYRQLGFRGLSVMVITEMRP